MSSYPTSSRARLRGQLAGDEEAPARQADELEMGRPGGGGAEHWRTGAGGQLRGTETGGS
uniref:Uncharacterized protein n=1 Tax=Leersia perrieri TaxID=77586 RepID=A0A0D9UWQ4_9ORYZ